MSDFEKTLENLKKEIFNQDIVKEYFALKEQIEDNEEIKKLNEYLVECQKKMTLNMNDDAKYFEAKREYEKAMEQYENYPLINNFKVVKEELYALLNEIKSILE